MMADCHKFSPNVFNKTKCQNCFRTKDSHSAEALESNRASRNVSKCGYLFVAPDWDFNVSVNRTKRWQRRWFVLYDDGELTYSLDEFPDTIPQGTIDMNKVLDVSDAEGITGNDFALSITTPEKVHFIKGTSKEESKWWFDVLCRVSPRYLSRVKHKRNATFPCGKATIPSPAIITQEYSREDDMRLNKFSRPKFLSTSEVAWLPAADVAEDEEVFAPTEIERRDKLISLPEDIPNESETSQEVAVEKTPKNYLSELEESENRRRNRRYLKRENRIQRNLRSRNDGVSKMMATESSSHCVKLEYLESIYKTDENLSDQKDIVENKESPKKEDNGKTNLRKSESLKNISAEAENHGLRRYHSFKGSHRKPSNGSLKRSTPKSTPPPVSPNTSADSPQSFDLKQENTIQGAFTRTGWLLRETHVKDWSRHWFVLKDSSLTYYRDPSAEGIMDGILDLNQVSSIGEQEADKYYAISLRMWDGRRHVLAAETEELREIWVEALQYASNLWSSESKEDFRCSEIVLPFHQTPTLLSDAEEPHQDSSPYTSDDQSEYFSLLDEASDLSSSPRTLPPSPPINRNVISLVKEKSRIRCGHGSPDMTSCALEIPASAESRTNQDFSSDFKDNDILREEESNEQSIHLEDRPLSPIEFMNGSQDIILNQIDNENKWTKDTKRKIIFNSRKRTSSSDWNEECHFCLNRKTVAQGEIKHLKKELKEAQSSFDTLEMFSYKLTQDMKLKEESYKSQIALMTAKIDDLTSKFTFAEKSYRQLKQKTSKNETKERRRSSLKNKDGLSVTKEYEIKLCDLEKKISSIESFVHMEYSEVDETEKSQSDTSSKLNESFNTTSESSETSTPLESGTSENKGFFSRLQSLMSRVDHVNNFFSRKEKSENAAENPKILLQFKDNEELGSLQEYDEWQPSTSSDTLQSSQTADSQSYPKNLLECQIMLSQRLNSHFQWLKESLETMSNQSTNYPENSGEQLNIIRSITRELNEVHQEVDTEQNCYLACLWIYELISVLEKLNNIDTLATLLKSNATTCAFKTIFHTLCITFAEYENYDLSGVLNLISSIPQFSFFCPIAKILFSENIESTSQSSNLSERLQYLETESVLASLGQAKLTRYDGLWNLLTEVPVQDDPASKPTVVNSVLDYTTSIATDIHRIAELQLFNLPLYLLKIENESIVRWRENSILYFKSGLTHFLDELKERCPMIHESTVSFHRLSQTMRKNIVHLVSELAFLNVCQTLLKSLKTEFSESDGNFALHKEWLLRVKKSRANCLLEGTFQCPQCTVIKNLLFQSSENIKWSDYVKKYNYYNVRKTNFKPEDSSGDTLERSAMDFPIKSQKDLCNNVTCPQCDIWIQKFCTAEMQHEVEYRNLKLKHNAEIKQLEECIIKSSEIHDQEILQKQNELSTVTAQLERLKIDYEDQKQMLKDLYEKKLNFDCEMTNEDNIREMYRAEIEDLKDMFKEGLAAIESSHNRITAEMERRHAEEIALLETEKQRALAIEAQATLTALEAMKKYHTQELIQTTASIKEDMKRNQNEVESESLYRNELDKLKGEIMRITEMYSSKCLENIALEDKVNSLRQQLKGAQNELCSLLTRNKDRSLCKASRHF